MLNIITGRTGSGKTRYIRNLATEIAKNESGKVIIIVPDQFSFETERGMLDLLGNEKINKYKQGCESLLPSLCLGLLEYNILSKEQKKEINRVYRFAKKNNRKYLYKERIKFIMRREL